jgi:hypothetical protein
MTFSENSETVFPGVVRHRITEAAQLPQRVPRQVAAQFAMLSPKTLRRAELRGELTAFRRNSRAVSYDRAEFLRWLGILD